MGCFYCDEHHGGREAIMFKVGDMKAGTLHLFKDQAHKGRCALALKSHKKELCECDEQERNDYCCRSGCCFRRYQEAVGLHQDQPRFVRRQQSAPAFPHRTEVRGRL